MGIRNRGKQLVDRLSSKTLDAKFLTEVQRGLGCSPFESDAVLDLVKEVYVPFFNQASGQLPPGKVTLIAVAADEDRKSTRLNSSHSSISYAVFCLKKK